MTFYQNFKFTKNILKGKNLFANSLIAFDVRNKKMLWYFQETCHDIWNFDIAAPPILTTINKYGARIDVAIAVTKLGNTIILDRFTGEPIFDYEKKIAPVSKFPGEKTCAYQPSFKLPEPFSRNIFTKDDITNLNKASRDHVTSIVEKSNYGFFPTHELNKDPFQSNVLKKYNCEKTIKFLKECVNDYLAKTTPFDYNGFPFVIQSAWLTKTKKHHYAHEHHHGDADISGVYYIKTNGEDGNLQFDNINSSMSGNFIMGALTSKQVAPLDTGLLMLWPGPLKHGTQENKTDSERISLSFNVNVARPCFSYKDGAFD